MFFLAPLVALTTTTILETAAGAAAATIAAQVASDAYDAVKAKLVDDNDGD